MERRRHSNEHGESADVESDPCLQTINPALEEYQLMLRRAFRTTGLPGRISCDYGTVHQGAMESGLGHSHGKIHLPRGWPSLPVVADHRWSVRMADSMLKRHSPDAAQWHYEHGLLLMAIERVWRATGESRFWYHVKDTVDLFINPDGTIRTYNLEEYNLDQINHGRVLFPLYQVTDDERYKRAIMLLRRQLAHHPRTDSGGFWHKQIYPHQIWLDGVYMAGPFYAEYARTFDEPAAFDDIVHEIVLTEQHTRDPKTGLLYHAWDERKQQRWADPETGCSPHFWGRAIGWFAMAIVDVLDYLPEDHPRCPEIIAIFERLTEAVARVQDDASDLRFQILDQGGREGNYLEASASCMFTYAIAKAVRKGYVPADWLAVACRAYQGILRNLITVDEQGLVMLERTCAVAGLGGNPYRDGSYEYYVGEPMRARLQRRRAVYSGLA